VFKAGSEDKTVYDLCGIRRGHDERNNAPPLGGEDRYDHGACHAVDPGKALCIGISFSDPLHYRFVFDLQIPFGTVQGIPDGIPCRLLQYHCPIHAGDDHCLVFGKDHKDR
jgi:hypothetical protein